MSRRFEQLSAAQALELIGSLSDSSGSEDDLSSESDSEEDVLYQVVEEPDTAPDVSEEREQPVRVVQRHLTKSQKTLAEADLRMHEPTAAGQYEVRQRGSVLAQWNTENEPTRRRRGPANILREAEGVRGDAKHVTTELDAFQLFLTSEIIDHVTSCTNKRLERVRQRKAAELADNTWKKTAHRYQPVTVTEMRAFIGLCILRSFYTDLRLEQLYDDTLGPAVFKATMGGKRFGTILRYITFDDTDSREERRKGDKFCLIRELFASFDENLRRHYSPSECITVDESLLRFRGRCPFKMYLPSKPGRYGMLFRTAADANQRYFWKLWPYSGRPEAPERAPPYVQLDGVNATVRYLVQEVMGSGRNITLDRFYTSVPLAEELAAERLTVVGTLNKNRRLLPAELTSPQNREPGSSMFAFRNGVTLTSHCPKPGKVVLALSTQHETPMVDERTRKPEIILYYNSTKGGVDVVDSMLETAMGKPTLRRWPTAVFFMMLGVAQVNGFTVLLLNRGSTGGGDRRAMRLALGQELVKPRLQERLADPVGLNKDTLGALAAVTGQKAARQQLPAAAERAARGRCVLCLQELGGGRGSGHRQAKEKLPKYPPCGRCSEFVCKNHSTSVRMCDACGDDDV
ncbi:PiggyBac transposable element-derived protein 4 [Amphibalanus amphitrite]|uniref:PiggyBac transposable element-derived protein 4 n=1 Tax=Amphibalanus amphitrite TaxID=1232801 RepID=A0A6A4WYP2_AMPAM|nr:PiggyBac transposable element-derived protein 4 [Amphibalanus amphitrite]